ncbi:MAG: hypothetical protein EXR48_06720 [Dehalococcoidia bacterium]|nr:hypothetical protein [Dehalococcoidia bacterium]
MEVWTGFRRAALDAVNVGDLVLVLRRNGTVEKVMVLGMGLQRGEPFHDWMGRFFDEWPGMGGMGNGPFHERHIGPGGGPRSPD